MRSAAGNRATHVTKNDIFRDVGFSPEKALALKFKARILVGILDEVKRKRYSQAQLVKVLHEHQPVVSNLLRGKITQMSIEKLLIYADRLGLSLDIQKPRHQPRRRRAA